MSCVRKYFHTPQTDRLIQEAYRLFRVYNNRKAINTCAKRLGWPKHIVTRRGQVLGLARVKELPWSDRETEVLERYHWMCPRRIVMRLQEAGFNRTETAVNLKLKRLRIRGSGDYYSATSLAEAFGVDGHKVTRWIRSGQLKAQMKGTERQPQQGGDAFVIHRAAVKDFALRCPDEYDLAKVEKYWYLDLITDGRICR